MSFMKSKIIHYFDRYLALSFWLALKLPVCQPIASAWDWVHALIRATPSLLPIHIAKTKYPCRIVYYKKGIKFVDTRWVRIK